LKSFKQVWNRYLLIPLGETLNDLRTAVTKEAFTGLVEILTSTPKFHDLIVK